MANEILIVDDNPDIRNILNELISDLGYRTRLAANYQQALSEIDKKLPDVAVLDVKLSNTENNEGLKLLDHIKTAYHLIEFWKNLYLGMVAKANSGHFQSPLVKMEPSDSDK